MPSLKQAFDKDDLRLVQIMANQAAMFIKNLQLQHTLQRESLLKTRLLAQFPRPIAERLARQPVLTGIPSERVETVTVLLSDVRGFTQLASLMEPEEVVQMLNDMFQALTPIVLKNNGTVDKYVGDALLAVFGSPDPDEMQWEHALKAALEMQEAIHQLAGRQWEGRTPFRIGIGIHCGPAIHGFIGAPARMEYTVIGNTINIGSRYCAAAAPDEILISPEVFARAHRSIEVDHPPRDIETKHEGRLKAYVLRKWKGKELP
jgi:adenylate cyclase